MCRTNISTMDIQSPPPIPESGLPPDWTLEQWNAYGSAWIKQEEMKAQNQPISVQPQLEPTVVKQVDLGPTHVRLQALQNNSNTNVLPTIAIVAICAVIVIILAGVLYVWANSLASDEIEGTWYNPAQTLTYSSNGDLSDSTSTFSEWRIDGNRLYMVDANDRDYEYHFQYKISGDVLFIAPIDFDGTIKGEDCSAYSRNSAAKDMDEFEDEVNFVVWPSWCNPE